MAPASTALVKPPTTELSHHLDPKQILKASKALAAYLERSKKPDEPAPTSKKSLLDGDDEDNVTEESIWLVVTAKQHILKSSRLKPNKIKLPHSLNSSSQVRICLITRDDTNKRLETLLDHASFPTELRSHLARIISFSSLRTKYKSYESQRQLYAEYDIFLADDRIYKLLPQALGKTFYKSTAKRPVPVIISGKPEVEKEKPEEDEAIAKLRKRQPKPATVASPEFLAAELEKALSSTMVSLGNSPTTQIRVAKAGWPVEWVAENAQAVAEAVVQKHIPNHWQGLRSLHIKGQHTASLPLWMAEELWVDESKILQESKDNEGLEAIEDEQEQSAPDAVGEDKPSRKRKAGVVGAEETVLKKAKSAENKKESAARKEKLKNLKAQALAETEEKAAEPAHKAEEKSKKAKTKAEALRKTELKAAKKSKLVAA